MPRSKSLPGWAGKVLYLVLLDRFANGDPSRDDFGRDEYSPTDPEKFQGGDLEGLRRRLPHLKRLGIDAVWLTPPTHGQWVNPTIPTRGYHGYWPYDFTAVDPHFGTLEDYRRMVADAHALGLKVIQDIVVNHTANYFTVTAEGFDPKHPERNWRPIPGAYPPDGEAKAPNDPVFRMNDARDPAHRKAGVYNFTPNIADFRDRRQTLTHAMGDLDDVNLENALAAKRMREIYRFWIEQVGVDGMRVDTVYYTPEAFYDEFLRKADAKDLGLKPFAAGRGNPEFFVFGEVWSYDYKAIGRYLENAKGAPRLDSAVDLPLNEALNQVFFRKAATGHMKVPLAAAKRNPDLWVTFADNHDVERVYARGTERAARQCLAALFTLPGLPCVYYGTESGLKGAREQMFDESHVDPKRPEHKFLKKLIALRKAHPALSTGTASVEESGTSCGVLAYTVAEGKSRYRVVFNTAPEKRAYALPGSGLGAKSLLSSDAIALGSVVSLPPESFLILDETRAPAKPLAPAAPKLLLKPAGPFKEPFPVRFSLPPGGRVKKLELLCDDDLERRRLVKDPRSGVLTADPEVLGGGKRRLRLLATGPGGERSLSKPVDVDLRCCDRLLAERGVPPANKGGFGGRRLRGPAEASYDGQLSLERVRVCARGRDLRMELLMSRVTDSWNPPEGYDHVYFGVFFEFPGRTGLDALPKLGAKVPGFRWDSGFLLYGWGSRSFSAKGSDSGKYGPPLPGEVKQGADPARRTVTFNFSERCFGKLKTFAGARVLITTWDGYLGELRALAAAPEDWAFSVADGGPLDAPKIYDHILLEL